MMLLVIAISFLCCGTLAQEDDLTNSTARGQAAKSLSVFQVVRFPNTACVGTASGSLNGTCYTASECTNKGGLSQGTCANGFGVCCTFTLSCGAVSSENCTYFQSSATQPAGQCGISVCKASSDICQLRLDFTTFVINGPNTLTITVTKLNVGGIGGIAAASTALSLATNCLTDTFSVTGGTTAPSVICGTNTNAHMYVDASQSCNNLLFQLGNTPVGTSAATRSWNIKISQISCLSTTLPPQGCTQYFVGITGVITSFNQAGGVQLANQMQNICIRRERGFCKLCLAQVNQAVNTDFSISGAPGMGFIGKSSICCGLGTAGAKTNGGDCLIVPNAIKSTANAAIIGGGDQFCGKFFGYTTSGTAAKTVCTTTVPYNIQFLTDELTLTGGANAGFKLAYTQTPCTS